VDVSFSRSRRGAATIAVGWLEDGLLTARAIHVGMWLSSHTSDYLAKMSQNQIKERLGTGWDTIQRALDELEGHGIITREVVADGRTRARTLITFDIGRWTSAPDSEPEPFPVSGQPVPRFRTTPFPVSGQPLEVLQEEGRDLSEERSRGDAVEVVQTKKTDPWTLLLEQVAIECGFDIKEISTTTWKRISKPTADIRSVGATPEEVTRRVGVWRERYPEIVLTPETLAKHWASLHAPAQRGPNISRSGQALVRGYQRALEREQQGAEQ